jgi:transcriptional regulator with XRE-family HTH domain
VLRKAELIARLDGKVIQRVTPRTCPKSLPAIALACSIDRSYMERIERGEMNITVEKLYSIASMLSCDPASLLPPVSELRG